VGYNVRMLNRTWLLGLLLAAACGGGGGAETLIGAPCESADDCDVVTGVCITDGEGGICTQTCTAPGAAGVCPVGSYCTRGAYTSAKLGAEGTLTLCFPACKEQSECRDGYECNGVSSGPGKVCTP
jgi:hypothetical protein